MGEKLKIMTYNMKGFKPRNYNYVSKIFSSIDIMMVQEHWLFEHEFGKINTVLNNSLFVAKSSMNPEQFCEGRPFGGVAIIWKPNLPFDVKVIPTDSNRLIACKIENNSHKILLFNLYMPCRAIGRDEEYLNVLFEIMSIIQIYTDYEIIIGGDFNSNFDLNELRTDILKEFSNENDLVCLTRNCQNVCYSFIDSRNNMTLIDHFFVNESFKKLLVDVFSIDEGDNLSDHLPIVLIFDLGLVYENINDSINERPKKQVCWSEATNSQIAAYKNMLSELLGQHNFDSFEASECHDNQCQNGKHITEFFELQSLILNSIELSSIFCVPNRVTSSNKSNKTIVGGWNKYVRENRNKAILWHNLWKDCGRPLDGIIADLRRKTRTDYHKYIYQVKSNQDKITREKIGKNLENNDSKRFWKEIKKLNKSGRKISAKVDGKTTNEEICNNFKHNYEKLYNSYKDKDINKIFDQTQLLTRENCNDLINDDFHLHVITPTMVEKAINSLHKGKTDTNYLIYTDSFINAPKILFKLLTNLFTIMLRHCLSSNVFNSVIFSPLVKNQRKDITDINNHRAIAINSCLSKTFDYIVMDYFQC